MAESQLAQVFTESLLEDLRGTEHQAQLLPRF